MACRKKGELIIKTSIRSPDQFHFDNLPYSQKIFHEQQLRSSYSLIPGSSYRITTGRLIKGISRTVKVIHKNRDSRFTALVTEGEGFGNTLNLSNHDSGIAPDSHGRWSDKYFTFPANGSP
jgi:hypothetical protein